MDKLTTSTPQTAMLIDWEASPIETQHSMVLQCFLSARFGFDLGISSGDRKALVAAVRGAISNKMNVLKPDRIPNQIGEWRVNEILIPHDQKWKDTKTSLLEVRSLPLISDEAIQQFYPKTNEQTRNRALRLIQGRKLFLTTTLESGICTPNLGEELGDVILFRCYCMPSMKTKVHSANVSSGNKVGLYCLYMAFGRENGAVLAYPYSCCGCYDGRGFCSHLLALLLSFRIVQQHEDDDRCFGWIQREP